jgi:hypothetical protein
MSKIWRYWNRVKCEPWHNTEDEISALSSLSLRGEMAGEILMIGELREDLCSRPACDSLIVDKGIKELQRVAVYACILREVLGIFCPADR